MTAPTTIEQLAADWEKLSPDQCVEIGVALAMDIVKPELWNGYVIDRTHRHRWQHVEACRAAIAYALHKVAAPDEHRWQHADARRVAIAFALRKLRKVAAPVPPVVLKEMTAVEARKVLAACLFGDILCDYSGDGRPPTATQKGKDGALNKLVAVAYAVATGRVGKAKSDIAQRAVSAYVEEVWEFRRGESGRAPKVKKFKATKEPKTQRKRARKKSPTGGDAPPPDLLYAIDNPAGRSEIEAVWNEPRPASDSGLKKSVRLAPMATELASFWDEAMRNYVTWDAGGGGRSK